MHRFVWTRCVWFVFAGFLFAGFVRAEEAAKVLPPEVEALVAEHEATWAKIRTLDVEYQMTASVPLGADPPSPKTGAARWVRDEGLERLVAERIVNGPDGADILCLAEFSAIGSQTRCLIRQLDGSNEGESFGEDYVRHRLALDTQPWMRQFACELGGPKTLRELATEWPTTLEEGETTFRGDRVKALKAMRPAEEGSPEAGSFVRVFLNLDKGCLVQRAINSRRRRERRGARRPRSRYGSPREMSCSRRTGSNAAKGSGSPLRSAAI
ncbi:MAG TPA: hypothetical protein VGN57_21990 [Pirellulaceae bacterium]|jgi:hypothetical protein|nr:hypothetical protein [Pirellulaceae bacterium]